MRKVIIISGIIILSLVMFAESGIFDALLVFLLSGMLPGTSIIVSPTMMMAGLIAISWLAIARITALGAINILTVRRILKRINRKQIRMPKRRYSRI